jgi:hypothetical protein
MGNTFFAQKNLTAALENYEAALAINERSVRADPTNTDWQSDLALTHGHISAVFRKQRNLAAALESDRASCAAIERLCALDPTNTHWQFKLAIALMNAAYTQHRLGESRQAWALIPRALSILKALWTRSSISGMLIFSSAIACLLIFKIWVGRLTGIRR